MPSPSNSLVAQEPVAVYQAVALLAVVAAGFVGVVIDPGTIVTVLVAAAALVTAVKAAIKARSKVIPVTPPSA